MKIDSHIIYRSSQVSTKVEFTRLFSNMSYFNTFSMIKLAFKNCYKKIIKTIFKNRFCDISTSIKPTSSTLVRKGCNEACEQSWVKVS